MRWTLFWVFIVLFVLIVLMTMTTIMFDVGNLSDDDQSLLVKGLLLEIGVAVIALFFAMFGLRHAKTDPISMTVKVRLGFPDMVDIRSLPGARAKCTFIRSSGVQDSEATESPVLDDNGPFLRLVPPRDAEYAFVSIELREETFSGSFALDSRLVEMESEQ